MAPKLKVTDDALEQLTEAELAGFKELQEEEAARLAAGGDDEDDGEGEAEEEAAAEKVEKVEKPAEKVEAAEKPEKKGKAEKKAEKVEAAKTEEKDDDAEDPGEAEGEGEEGDEAEGEEGEEAEDDGEGEDDGEKQPEKQKVEAHLPAYQMTTEEVARLATVEKELDAIAEKFDEGELTAKEMREQSKALAAELDELKEKRTIAKMHGADQSSRWYGQTIPAFLTEHTEYKKGSLRFDLLDQTVKKLQAASDDPTNPLILVEAHKQITEEFGATAAEKTNGAAKKKNGNGRTIPPTLSGLPSADIEDTSRKSEFVHLERLRGEAHERAVAKLTPDQRERYLLGG